MWELKTMGSGKTKIHANEYPWNHRNFREWNLIRAWGRKYSLKKLSINSSTFPFPSSLIVSWRSKGLNNDLSDSNVAENSTYVLVSRVMGLFPVSSLSYNWKIPQRTLTCKSSQVIAPIELAQWSHWNNDVAASSQPLNSEGTEFFPVCNKRLCTQLLSNGL